MAFFPYGFLQENPYQNQIIAGLEANEVEVIKIPGKKFFPLLQLIKYNPDIVHIFWPHDFYIGKNSGTTIIKRAMLTCTLPILKRYTSVYSADNLVSHDSETISEKTEKIWIAKILKKCRGIIYMSKSASELYQNFYTALPKNKLIISHVNFNSNYPNNLSLDTCRKLLSLKDETVFCIFGRIHPYKGVLGIINAFKQLKNTDVVLLIVGKCSSADYYQQIITACGNLFQNRIRVVNEFIPNSDVQLYLNASDYLLLNYVDTPLNPGSAIIAETFNIPVIAPETSVLKEIVGKPGNYFFLQNNTASLQKIMEEVCQIEQNRSLRSTVNTESDPKIIGKKLKEFYLSLLQKVH